MFRAKDTYGKHRYVGRSKAQVIDNRDPANLGRVQVNHPILGETVWIHYLRQPNQFDVPSIGDVIYIECDSGEHEFPVGHGTLTLGYPNKALFPDVFKRNVPTNRGMYTPGGHLIEMDDGESNPTKSPNDKDLTTKSRGIRITSKAGNKIQIMEDESQGVQHILLEDISGNLIRLDTLNKSVEINAALNQNNTIGQNYQLIVQGNITVQCIGNVSVQCADATVNATSADIVTTGNTVIQAATIQLNGSTGKVLTDVTDPVVDTIFGAPTVGVATVKAG